MKGTLTSLKYITGDVVRVRYCTFYEFRFRHDVMEIMESIPLAHLVLAACGFFFLFFFFLPRLWENRVCNLLSLVFDRYFWIVVRIGLRYDISYQKENKRTNFIYKTSAQKGQTLLRTISLLQIKITFDNWRLRWTIVLLVLLVYWWYY